MLKDVALKLILLQEVRITLWEGAAVGVALVAIDDVPTQCTRPRGGVAAVFHPARVRLLPCVVSHVLPQVVAARERARATVVHARILPLVLVHHDVPREVCLLTALEITPRRGAWVRLFPRVCALVRLQLRARREAAGAGLVGARKRSFACVCSFVQKQEVFRGRCMGAIRKGAFDVPLLCVNCNPMFLQRGLGSELQLAPGDPAFVLLIRVSLHVLANFRKQCVCDQTAVLQLPSPQGANVFTQLVTTLLSGNKMC
mmetsp:Transcript_50564/g.126998  ORF Transcript_50564/g.126998 Transcript_50564/m.126998 type:complete len:257 (-) Transcript_50564:161-931(-)